MPFAGTFVPAASPGETQPYSLDFGTQLEPGDSIQSVISTLSVHCGSDPNAAACLVSAPSVSGTVVTQMIGGALPGGLQPDVDYIWAVTIVTAFARTRVNYAYLPCAAIS